MRAAVVFFLLLSVVQVWSAFVIPCSGWPLYKQCDGRWANNLLGHSPTVTICKAGCAMSSVAMALQRFNVRVNGQVTTPATLNTWLKSNGGYVNGYHLMWNSIAKLGRLHMIQFTKSISKAQLKKYIQSCNPVIACVRNGGHWVLVNGYDSANDNVYHVEDAGYNVDRYTYGEMVHFVVYGGSRVEGIDEYAVQPPLIFDENLD